MGLFNRKLTPEVVAEYLKGLSEEEKAALDALLDDNGEKPTEPAEETEKAEENAEEAPAEAQEENATEKQSESAEEAAEEADEEEESEHPEESAEEAAEKENEEADFIAEFKTQIADLCKTVQALEARIDAIKPADAAEDKKEAFGAEMAGASDENADTYHGSVADVRTKSFGF